MGIIGSPITNYVSDQIKMRQSVLGDGVSLTGGRNIETLQAFTTSTPWMRLASAVSISNGDESKPGKPAIKVVKDKGILDGMTDSQINGQALAKSCVLQGIVNGPTNIASVVSGSAVDFSKAYGFGYNESGVNSQSGYVPPPGVTSLDFEYKNDGALAFATVNIKAFSATQFAIIDLLYMRPGYTCLLEFGHTQYIDNSGNLQNLDTTNTSPFDYIFSPEGDITYSQMAKLIANTKQKYQGNYEGFFGRITKFNWKFNEDGSYDITIKLTGTGDVISSLKSNMGKVTSIPSSIDSSFKLSEKPEVEEPAEGEVADTSSLVISEAGASQLNFELYALFQDQTILDHEGILGNKSGVIGDIKFTGIPLSDGSKKSFTASKALAKFDVNDWGGTVYSPITLIKFGAFLTMLQKICNVSDGKKNTLLNFEIVEEYANNPTEGSNSFMVSYPGNFSADPNVCVMQYFSFVSDIFTGSPTPQLPLGTTLNEKLKGTINIKHPDRKKLKNPSLAIPLRDVFVNINFIANVIKNISGDPDPEKNATSDVPVLDLLNGVLQGINNECGNINNFRVIYNEFTAQVEIISESPILTPKDANESLTVLNTFGLSPLQGSFVTQASLNSELSDSMATELAIGAQSNGNQTMSNATTFSTYSKGLEDVLMVKKISTIKNKNFLGEDKKEDILCKQWEESDGDTNFDQVYNDREFNPDTGYIGGLKSITSTFAPAIIGRYANESKSPMPFFLPFNLDLTMHGLGGIKIYDGFQVNGRGLPATYDPTSIKLLVKSLSHTVSLEGWKTKISTISFPLSDVTATDESGKGRATPEVSFGTGTAQFAEGGASNYTSPNITGKFDIDLTRTLNSSSRMKIVNAFGWPITVQSRGGKTYGKKIGMNGSRVVYEIDQAYKTKNNKPFSYTFKNGDKFTSRSLHQGIHAALRSSFQALDNAGIGKAGIKNLSASVYARDTTNAPGLLSGHSFGVAMDFNSDIYSYGNKSYQQWQKDVKNKKSKNYKYAKAIDILQKTGKWVWGGNYSKTKDSHHFTFKPYSS
jgi:hypothetical protein